MTQRTLLLTDEQYVHIIDNNTGRIRLVEGPFSGLLQAHEAIYKNEVQSKIVLKENQYCIILNPVVDGTVREGEREMRRGPRIFSLHPSEVIDVEISDAYSLDENQGIYIQDLTTGAVRLELGPAEVMLDANEVLYEKTLSSKARLALGLDPAADYLGYMAVRIELDENEVIQLVDDRRIRYELGPKTIFLGPFEQPKILTLSGSTPKRPDVITTAKVRLGPDFLSDILTVSTHDNALLKIHVRYKWRFQVDPDNLDRIFSINDFIGYASETIASMLRGIAAKHDFEAFHSNAAQIIKETIFTKDGEALTSRIFENGFEIFSVDIKQITPEDPEIEEKLNAAISHNMDIYVQKMKQQAELDEKRQTIEGEKVIEEQRLELIELQSENYQRETLHRAKLQAEAVLEEAKGRAKAQQIRLEADLADELKRTAAMIDALAEDAANYLRSIELETFGNADTSLIVPHDSRLWLHLDSKDRLGPHPHPEEGA